MILLLSLMAIHPPELLLLLLLPLLPVLILILRGQKQPKLPPGPSRLPIIGNLHQLGKHPHRTLCELSKRYGPLMHLQLGRVSAVVVSSAQMAEEVLKTHDLQLCSRPALVATKCFSYNFSDVGFSPYSATWTELRKMIHLGLLNPRMVERSRPVREEEVEQMVRSISSLASLSEPIDLSKLLRSLSINIICRVAFGRRSDHNEGRGDQKDRFHQFFSECEALLVGFFAADHFPWAGWIDVLSGLRTRLEKNFAELDAFLEEVIEEHLLPTRRTDGEEDFVDVLLRHQKEDNTPLTMDHVKGVLMNALLAGTETSSATVEYAMAELLRNPNTMSKAQEEVRKIAGEKGKVEEEDIPQLSYLKSVVKETLRLHPATPLLLPREAMDHVKINGYDVLQGTRVIVNAWAIGRDPDSWERSDEFIPERFMNSTVDFRGHDFCFIPFGAGRRICPGLSFGIMTVELALASLLYSFDWVVPDEIRTKGVDMDEAAGLTVHLKTGLRLKASEYNHSPY